MNFFGKLSLRKQLMAIGGCFLVMFVVATQVVLSHMDTQVKASKQDFIQNTQNLVGIEGITVDFKTQVQEWKNTLIRGHDDGDRKKYWAKFQKLQTEIQANAKALASTLDHAPEAQKAINQFIANHDSIYDTYEKGFKAFVDSGFDHKAADTIVRGIDREPTEILQAGIDAMKAAAAKMANQSSDEMHSSIIFSNLIVVGLAIIMLATLFFVFSRLFSKPLKKLQSYLQSFANADFTRRVNIDQLGDLGACGESLKQAQDFLTGFLNNVRGRAEELEEASNQLSQASKEVQIRTKETFSHVDQSATAIHEMSMTIQEVAQNANNAADQAKQAESSASRGYKDMQSTIHSIDLLAQDVESASEVISKLEEETQSIGTVLDVIIGIAEQTNLLALNAAIEAARAGEQGRGFAVVADEVRSLAQRTQQSTEEIRNIIDNLRTGSANAVEAMNHGTARTQTCVEQAKSAGVSLQEINSAVASIVNLNAQIAVAAEQQSNVSEEMSRNVSEVKDSTDDINTRVLQLGNLNTQLMNVSNSFKQDMTNIKLD